jgi:hypothetical protein
MDGGRILRAALATRLDYLRATFWAATTGKVIALTGIAVMLFWFESPRYLGALLFFFILMAGNSEYQAVRRRELEDAHWRAVLERIYGRPVIVPPAPPIIER